MFTRKPARDSRYSPDTQIDQEEEAELRAAQTLWGVPEHQQGKQQISLPVFVRRNDDERDEQWPDKPPRR